MEALRKLRTVIPIEKRNKWLVFSICLMALSLDNLSVSGGITSTVSVQEAFNTTSTNATWVISAYALTLGSFILIFGKLADILGADNIFLFGTCIMSLFALICAVIEKSVIALIVFRAFQGIGASALVPSGIALTAGYFAHDFNVMQRANRLLSIALTGAFGIGTLIGGAFALTNIGYKAFFYFVFALSFLCAITLTFTIIPVPRHSQLHLSDLNYGGVFILVAGLLLIILGLTEGGHKWRQAAAYVTLPIGFLLVISVFLFETVYIRGYRVKHANEMPMDDGVAALKDAEAPTTSEVSINHSSSSEANIDSIAKPTADETSPEPKKKVDWRLTMDYLFPPECLKIPNFLVFLCLVITFFIDFTVLLTALFQYHQFIEHNTSIISSLKVFSMSVGEQPSG
ncbi:unnamed protein product [Ambrosiozyma monospora]|uniref:Unnamed protein product n=1 Tax=Ambrosiozyma monospora TaxID=43982 RepID=A0ACB5SXE2_AMBMO|nr:unnamed protein product [Ambrosiozyma monospora]